MMDVGGIERAIAAGPTARPRPGLPLSGFAVPAKASPSSTVSAGQPTQAAAVLSGLLALQETDPDVRDRSARRRGQDILAALAELQRALLAGGGSADVLGRLAALTADLPRALDPRLERILAAITLRARVEMARRHFDTDSARCSRESPT